MFQPYIPSPGEQPILIIAGIQFYKTGITIPPDLTQDIWAQVFQQVEPLARYANFWIGDLVLAGEDPKGLGMTDLATGSIANIASVCRRVPIQNRIAHENLSFWHHGKVARLDVSQQREWLTMAAENGWSVDELGRQITIAQAEGLTRKTIIRGAQAQVLNYDPVSGRIELLITDYNALPDTLESFVGVTLTAVISCSEV